MLPFPQTALRGPLPLACLLLAGTSLNPLAARAQAGPETIRLDEVVVSATGTPTPAREVASSVTVITADQIQREQRRTLPQALAAVPGLNIVQIGGPGGQTSVFMRGTNSTTSRC